MLALQSRRAVAVLSCSLLIGGVAGCGSSEDSGGGSSSGSSSSTDGRALLNEMTITPGGTALKSGTVGLSISGSVETPKADDLHKLDGKVALTVSAEQVGEQKSVPPVKIEASIDGDYVDDKGKAGNAKYAAGITYTDDQLYVNWKNKDYAFGKELTKQFAGGFTQGLASEVGDTSDLKAVTADPAKLITAMDLEPGTWHESVKVEDGPTLDGVATYAVTGPVNLKTTAKDISDGLKELPAAFPDVPGLKDLEKMGDVSDADVKEAEDSLTTRNAAIYIGKDDKLVRRIKLDLAGKDTGDSPTTADISIQIDMSKINKPQGIAAPKSAAPVTDLFIELQKDFPGIGGLLGA